MVFPHGSSNIQGKSHVAWHSEQKLFSRIKGRGEVGSIDSNQALTHLAAKQQLAPLAIKARAVEGAEALGLVIRLTHSKKKLRTGEWQGAQPI